MHIIVASASDLAVTPHPSYTDSENRVNKECFTPQKEAVTISGEGPGGLDSRTSCQKMKTELYSFLRPFFHFSRGRVGAQRVGAGFLTEIRSARIPLFMTINASSTIIRT